MDATTTPTPSATWTAGFEKLLFSSMRLSSAATLFGVDQIESVVNLWQDTGRMGKQIDRFGTTVESLTQCLVEEISPGKKEALDSIADLTTKVVRQSLEGMSLLDPRQMFRLAATLAQRSSEILIGWTGKSESPAKEEPKLAADVLVN